jgi:hypothetical protein
MKYYKIWCPEMGEIIDDVEFFPTHKHDLYDLLAGFMHSKFYVWDLSENINLNVIECNEKGQYIGLVQSFKVIVELEPTFFIEPVR